MLSGKVSCILRGTHEKEPEDVRDIPFFQHKDGRVEHQTDSLSFGMYAIEHLMKFCMRYADVEIPAELLFYTVIVRMKHLRSGRIGDPIAFFHQPVCHDHVFIEDRPFRKAPRFKIAGPPVGSTYIGAEKCFHTVFFCVRDMPDMGISGIVIASGIPFDQTAALLRLLPGVRSTDRLILDERINQLL